MTAEQFIETNYYTTSGLDADTLIEDKTGVESSFEDIAEAYHRYKLDLLGIANAVNISPKLRSALNEAVSAIYFNDNSEFITGLYGVVRYLTGLEEPSPEDIGRLFKELNPL